MTERGRGRVYRPTYRDRRTGELKTSAVWWIALPIQGEKGPAKHRQSSHSTRRSDAVKLLNEKLGDVGRGLLVGPSVENTMFADLADILIENLMANGRRSVDRAKRSVAHLKMFFGFDRAMAITSDRIVSYVRHRQSETAANATINRELAALKRMFRLGERARKVAHRPYIEMLHEANVRKGFLEWPGFQAILAHLPVDLRPVFETAYITGWRVRSELLTRQKTHVDLVNGWLRLEPGEGKTGEGRQFPLTPELRAVLEQQLARTREIETATGQVTPWVFHRNGEPIKSYRRAWRSACKKAGLPDLIPHDFRRTAVRNLERAGVSRSAAMKMVGHKTQSIYSRYAIADESMLKDGAVRLSTLHAHEVEAAERARVEGVVVPITTARSRSGKVRAKSRA
jgi:integrase